MPHILGKKFLRVRTPVLIEGKRPKITNGRVEYSETHLPLTARKFLERENARVTEDFRHIITEINDDEYTDPQTLVKGAGARMATPGEKERLLARLKELEALEPVAQTTETAIVAPPLDEEALIDSAFQDPALLETPIDPAPEKPAPGKRGPKPKVKESDLV